MPKFIFLPLFGRDKASGNYQKPFYLFLFIFLIHQPASYPQVNDFGVWTSIALGHKITRNLSVIVEEQVRFDMNASHISQFFTDGGFEYSISRNLKAGFYYRFINSNRETYYSKRHRWYTDITYKFKLKPLQFLLRTRLQEQLQDIHSSEDGRVPVWHSRNKLTARLELVKKYFPYVSSELFYMISSPGVEGRFIDKMRYTAGINYEFNRKHTLDINYLIQREKNIRDPFTDYVAGLGYVYTF